jgi:hypothetical protein
MDQETTLATADTIHGWMTMRELEWLYRTARSLERGAVWVELGVWKGRSFFAVAMGLPKGCKLVAVDSFAAEVTSLEFVPTKDWVFDHFQAVLAGVRKLREDLQIEVLRRDTALAGELFADLSVDVVSFDADHSAEGLARDLLAWVPKVKAGGLLCGHDYNPGFPGVMQVVDEYFPRRSIVDGTSIWRARKA